MVDPSSVITGFLFKWSQEKYILLCIRFIMGTLMVVYFMVAFFSLMASIRRAMQASPVRYPLFPVWALALVIFRSSASGLSGTYGTQLEVRNVLKLLVVAYMNATQGSKIGHVPCWIFWGLLVLKCLYRIVTHRRASKSLWHGRSSELLQAYMGPNQPQSNFIKNQTPEMSRPAHGMEACKYLVYGESEESRNCSSKQTSSSLNINGLRSVITLDTICQRDEVLEEKDIEKSNRVCLAFALSCLLRCRLEGATLHPSTVSMNRKLIGRIRSDAFDALFDIMEMDVGFLRDCLVTSYPMVFLEGLLSLSLALILAVLKCSVACWLSSVFLSAATRLYRNRKTLLARRHHRGSFASDLGIAGGVILMTAFAEEFEVLRHIYSDWTSLLRAGW